jgi:peroxiredoxin (alkyl hydroperoxide reductase subunit C)
MIKKLLSRNKSNGDQRQSVLAGALGPGFSLVTTSGDRIELEEYRGRPVVLVFYPADQTPVCTSQLALYNEALPLIEEYNAQLLGISVDDLATHQAFSDSLGLNYPLLSDDDPAGAVARAYGVFDERDGKSDRALFVLDDQGVIRWSHVSPRNVNPGANGILDALESLPVDQPASKISD